MVMGNLVTTTGSGLACPDWPLCYGTVVPPLEVQIWFEWGHRLMGGLTGMLILISTVLTWIYTKGAVKWLTFSSLSLLGIGAVFGGIIVLIEAPLLEGPLHIAIISFHIVLATIIFTMMILSFRFFTAGDDPEARKVDKIYPIIFGIVIVQVMLGILVRYGQASLACPDFPTCRGVWVPEFADFKVILHFLHRLNALIIFTVVTGYFVVALKAGKDVVNASVTMVLMTAQATIGIYIVWSQMYLPFIVGHGATGFALLGWLAYRCAHCFTKEYVAQLKAPSGA
jgi:cytochrome c oxidase assembly protein subunit 15